MDQEIVHEKGECKMKKAFMIIGAILTAVGIGLLVWTLAAADLDLSKPSTAKYETST